MKMHNLLSFLSLSAFAIACQNSNIASPEEELSVSSSGYYAIDKADAITKMDPVRSQIAQFFLVEQFSTKEFDSMKKAIKEHPPGGIVYWNPESIGGSEIAAVNASYSLVAKTSGHLPLLLSTDYEGGGLNQTISGKSVIGIQRFIKGMTKLAHPMWLGQSLKNYSTELCKLHGSIMAKELKLAGINYPLATVSDLGKNLFANRGISTNPEEIAECMTAMVEGFSEVKGNILVTKHFPGLGETVGDTHDMTVVSRAKSMTELEKSLKPFRDVITNVNNKGWQNNYSILASHAKYDVLDKENITTVSEPILKNLLRDEMKFQGIVVSDAMWMGEYGKLSTDDILPIYVKSVLSGMDLLMIAGRTFPSAVNYFRAIYDETLSEKDMLILENVTGMNWSALHKKFVDRIIETHERMSNTKKSLQYAQDTVLTEANTNPESKTTKERTRYNEILRSLGMSI